MTVAVDSEAKTLFWQGFPMTAWQAYITDEFAKHGITIVAVGHNADEYWVAVTDTGDAFVWQIDNGDFAFDNGQNVVSFTLPPFDIVASGGIDYYPDMRK